MELIEEDFNIFQNAVEKNSFDEENFKTALFHCFFYSGNNIDCTVFVNFYAKFDFMLINIEFTCFSFILRLLVQLAQVHVISLFEVHQHISNVIANLSSNHDYIDKLDKNHIFQYLLNLSCAKETQSSLSKLALITEKDIDNKFNNELYSINKNSILFLKRNYFLNEFRTIFSNSLCN
ncbi:unnamed protein product, partial [Rotaria sp. Silwood2]